jgi:uncharacterized protein (TIRG00374 family)
VPARYLRGLRDMGGPGVHNHGGDVSPERSAAGEAGAGVHARDSRSEAGEQAAELISEPIEGNSEPSFIGSPKRIAQTILAVIAIVVAIYFLLPALVGIEDAIATMGRGDPVWIAIALAFGVAMFFSYVALFRGVIGEHAVHLAWRESYQITMAGLAATRLFSAGGAGGIVLTYWALRKSGMQRKQSAARMVAFLVLLYGVYMLTLVVDGMLLHFGVVPGPAPVGLTLIPAVIAAGIVIAFLLIALIPGDLEWRFSHASQERRTGRIARRLATVPSTLAVGTRTAIDFIRTPSRGGLAIPGAIGFWAANIGILWASFNAFGAEIPIAVVIQGFFVGMVANLFPFAPGGVGAVDAGMIGTFVLFNVAGVPGATVFAAVLTYRLIAFWLPIPPGVIGFVQLRRTVARWERERAEPGVGSGLAESLPGSETPASGHD